MEALTMKFKYDKSKGLLFFINPLLPVKGYSFMNICAIMFTRSEDYIKRMTQTTVTHEKTHTKQMLEMGIVFFYLWYVIEWFIKLLASGNAHTAYRNISLKEKLDTRLNIQNIRGRLSATVGLNGYYENLN